jgi:2-phosphoglycolate phosphatase
MTRLDAVLFDLDGTLVDTAPELTGAFNHSLQLNGLEPVTLEQCRGSIGAGVEGLVGQLLPHLSSEVRHAVLSDYQRVYNQHYLLGSQLFPGLAPILDRLSHADVPLWVVTNKPHAQAVELVRHVCAKWPQIVVLGAAPQRPLKPDPRLALEIHSRGIRGRGCLFVGDTPIDIEFARNAGFQSCAVTWGYRTAEQLAASHPDYSLDSAQELLALLMPALAQRTCRVNNEHWEARGQ